MATLNCSDFKEKVKEIIYMRRVDCELSHSDKGHNDGDIVIEDIKNRIKVTITYALSNYLYYMIFELKDGSEKFFRSNGEDWEECNSEKECYEYVPEEFKSKKHKLKHLYYKRYVNKENIHNLVFLSFIMSSLGLLYHVFFN